jgi:hypothetical protein
MSVSRLAKSLILEQHELKQLVSSDKNLRANKRQMVPHRVHRSRGGLRAVMAVLYVKPTKRGTNIKEMMAV